MGHLIGTLEQFFKRLGLPKLRFKPAFNPYTEPSMEIFSYSEQLGKWIEVGNSGMFRPEMLQPMGLPEDVTVIAWGLSLERWGLIPSPSHDLKLLGSLFLPVIVARSMAMTTRTMVSFRVLAFADRPLPRCPPGFSSSLLRPTMIMYGIDNIRDLFGHKVCS